MSDTSKKGKEKDEKKIYMKVPGQTQFLELIRKAILDLGSKMGFSEDELAKVEMAVDEACTNVMNYAYTEEKDICLTKTPPVRRRTDPEKPVELKVNVNSKRLLVEINDRGRPFEFESEGDIDLDKYLSEMQVGGLGIYIIKNFMDEVSYEYKPGVGNKLRMVKYLGRSSHADRL